MTMTQKQTKTAKCIWQSIICVACVAGGLVTVQPAAAESNRPSIDDTRAVLEEWVETRRLISKERQDFELGKEMLNERIELIQNEIKELEEKIKTAEASITEADKKRGELIEENDRLKASSSSLVGIAKALESRTKSLLKKVPDPIRERVRPLSQRFPKDPKDTKLSLAERYQNIVGVLNEVNKFNREITVTSEVRELSGGATAEVTALYIGIGQGYYVNGNGDVAGIGRSSKDGWVWTPANESAAEIAQSIAILKNEAVASFVQLPVEIK